MEAQIEQLLAENSRLEQSNKDLWEENKRLRTELALERGEGIGGGPAVKGGDVAVAARSSSSTEVAAARSSSEAEDEEP